MGYDYTHITAVGQTDVGRVRQHNEDSIGVHAARGWYCVADGMGGEEAGEVASAQVVQSLASALAPMPDREGFDNLHAKQELIGRGLRDANHQIRSFVAKKGLKQSGSTAVALALDFCQPDKALMVHVGDSRIYRMRKGKLDQMTVDHSVAAAAGLHNENEIPIMFRGMVTKAVGIKEHIEPEFQMVDIEPGDLYLLCSDGLSGMISDKKISQHLRKAKPDELDETAKSLIHDANAGGGKDNISAILVHIGESAMFPPSADQLARPTFPEDPTTDYTDPLGSSESDSEDSPFSATMETHATAAPQITPDAPASAPARPPAPAPPSPPAKGETLATDTLPGIGMKTVKNPMESSRPSGDSFATFLREKMYIVLFALAILACLAYVVYVGFIKKPADVESSAFPDLPDDATVLSQLSAEPSPALAAARPTLDLRDGSAIEKALNTGAWGEIKRSVDQGRSLPEGLLGEKAQHSIQRWDFFLTKPDEGYDAYLRFHQRVLKTGIPDRLNAAFLIEDPSTNPEQRANELCQFATRFDQQVAPMLQELAMRATDIISLFQHEGQHTPYHLEAHYAVDADTLNITQLQSLLPEVQQLHKQLIELARQMQRTGSSPVDLAAIDPRPFSQLGEATAEWINRLNAIMDTKSENAHKSMVEEMPEDIRAVGLDLLKHIDQAQTALDAKRGSFSSPLSFQQVEELLPDYRKLTRAIQTFNLWHFQSVETESP
jgi:protein phosphatase